MGASAIPEAMRDRQAQDAITSIPGELQRIREVLERFQLLFEYSLMPDGNWGSETYKRKIEMRLKLWSGQ